MHPMRRSTGWTPTAGARFDREDAEGRVLVFDGDFDLSAGGANTVDGYVSMNLDFPTGEEHAIQFCADQRGRRLTRR